MKIKFGNSSGYRDEFNFVSILTGPAMVLFFYTRFILLTLDNSHDALLRLLNPNMTLNSDTPCCGMPYEECLCSVQSMRNISSQVCLTDRLLLDSRLVPLLSFILQICFVRKMFTVTGKYSRYVVKSLWISAVLIFFIIVHAIFRDSCSHRVINYAIFGTGGILLLLVFHDIFRHLDRNTVYYSSYNRCTSNRLHVIDVEPTHNEASENIADDRPIVWKNIL